MAHAGGRPTKLTPAVQQQVVNAIQAGNYIEVAAAVETVDAGTTVRVTLF